MKVIEHTRAHWLTGDRLIAISWTISNAGMNKFFLSGVKITGSLQNMKPVQIAQVSNFSTFPVSWHASRGHFSCILFYLDSNVRKKGINTNWFPFAKITRVIRQNFYSRLTLCGNYLIINRNICFQFALAIPY